MICLVYGPSSSGKSAWAEGRACRLAGDGARVYLATMQAGGSHARARIEKHLAQRAGKDFVTFEVPTLGALGAAALPTGSTALLDDIGNLVANEMFGTGPDSATTAGRDPEALANSICSALLETAGHVRNLVVVADAAGEAGWRGDGLTREWIECCGATACKLAAVADEVVEVRCGIALQVKTAGARGTAGTPAASGSSGPAGASAIASMPGASGGSAASGASNIYGGIA